jgi:hypothetical protein
VGKSTGLSTRSDRGSAISMIHSSRPLLRRVYIGAAGGAVVVLVAALLVVTHAFGESMAGQWVQVATGSYRGGCRPAEARTAYA